MIIEPEIQVYKNKKEKKPEFINTSNHDKGNAYETRLCLDLHTGTHIDAPLHMIEGGETTEIYQLEEFVTDCKVIDLTDIENHIGRSHLENHEISEGDFLLFKTSNSFIEDFDFNFIYLAEDGTDYLLEKRVKGVGIDALGIERSQPEHPTHKKLLSRGIMIIEGLRLKDINSGRYQLIIAPLKIRNVEAAPARALLIKE